MTIKYGHHPLFIHCWKVAKRKHKTLTPQKVGVLFIGLVGIDHHGIRECCGGFFCGMIYLIGKWLGEIKWHYLTHCRWQQSLSVRALNAIKLSLLQNRFAKVQGDTVTKDYLDLRLNEAVALLRQEMTKSHADLMKEISALKMDSQFTKWTNKAILLSLGVITSALIKIAFFH